MQENKPVINKQAGRWKLFAVIAVCAAPLIASYVTYYFIKPEGRTNYGALLDPRSFPIPASLKSAGLEAHKGKWMLLQVNSSHCQKVCEKKLYDMRQLRLAQGKEMTRVERVWLITDNQPFQSLQTAHMQGYQGTQLVRANPQAVQAWLPVESGTVAADHLYLIDPLGNLMMRFPKDADPNKIKKDLAKLLRASRIG